ncbi:MAG: hypothetical protein EXS22_04125 [Pedosphaera sp.]|nr:hypothetical protein [Pedosphaera sp.]
MPLLREWRRLTQAETFAIQARDWTELGQLQEAKSELQAQLSAIARGTKNHETTVLMADLISREVQNHGLMQTEMKDLRSQLDASTRSIKTIHSVHRAYGSKPEEARQNTCWEQLS